MMIRRETRSHKRGGLTDVSNRNFGLLIAYIVPGFVALWAVGLVHPPVADWLSGPIDQGPTIGGVLYVTIGSVALGMLAGAVRWAVIDTVHGLSGLQRPSWSDKELHKRLAAYTWIIENYYRYYQFYGNTLISLAFAYAIWRSTLDDPTPGIGWLDPSFAVIAAILFAGSRSALARYYRRAGDLLDSPSTEGHDHDQRRRTPKAPRKPQAQRDQPKGNKPAGSGSRGEPAGK